MLAAWNWARLRAIAFAEARRILDDDSAADAAQEALIRAWRHADACRTPRHPDPWLRAIARREALRIAAGHGSFSRADLSEIAGELEPHADLRVDVRRALTSRLTDRERQLLAYRYWLDYTDAQIAAALDVPVGTAKIRLHRARRKLEAALK